MAAVQLAVDHGCIVIGTAGTQHGLDLVKAQGAHAVFNHHDEGYPEKIKVILTFLRFKMVYLIGPDGLVNRRFANFHKMVWMTTV